MFFCAVSPLARVSALSSARKAALRTLLGVLRDGRSADALLSEETAGLADARDASFARALVFGVLRDYRRLCALRDQLLRSALKTRDQDVALIIILGLYQMMAMEVPAHAAVSETVALARQRGKPWAAKLVNALLRRFQREQDALLAAVEQNPAVHWSVPDWLLAAFAADWPEHWQVLLVAQNERAPMTLRVNRRQTTVADYQKALSQADIAANPLDGFADALVLEQPVPVSALPGFADGLCSVQDGSAQLAADILAPQAGERVLDACAAPGGKTAHLLERADVELLALDEDPVRLERVAETLNRLQLSAHCQAADATAVDTWWDQRLFDAILLDAPCSGTGVIRRHPDIKWLRRPEDPGQLAARQQRLLNALWPLLRIGGRLVYSTCSVLSEENERVIEAFIRTHADAKAAELGLPVGRSVGYGQQILTGESGVDGFYYACLEKV